MRKSIGTDDNSGDYNEYPQQEELMVNDISVTVKGSGDLIYLAVWTDGDYSYSLSCTSGLERSQALAMITEMMT